jgi:NAD(P)-dependent dehydrogenase (short-subunit alcohol dehydrogenase family)
LFFSSMRLSFFSSMRLCFFQLHVTLFSAPCDFVFSYMLLSFQVNLVGTLRVTKACLPLLKSCGGRVLMVSSVAGVHAYPGLSVYCATKHAIEGLAQVGLHHAVSVMHTSLEY